MITALNFFSKIKHFISHKTPQKSASYLANNEFKYISNTELKIWGYKDTLGISQIRYTDLLDKPDDGEKVTDAHENKSFFSSFSSPLKKFVNNKVLTYLDGNTEEKNISDDQLVEKIIKTPESGLDAIFEKMTYEKLAKLINNISDEQAKKLVNYIMPWHFEKVIELITQDKLDKLFNENANDLSLEKLTEQELKKLSNENISDEQLENIIILPGEEKLTEKLEIIPNENLERIISNTSNDKLTTIINNASDESLGRIVDIIDSDDHNLSIPLVGQIITLMHKKCVKQEAEQYNSDFTIYI